MPINFIRLKYILQTSSISKETTDQSLFWQQETKTSTINKSYMSTKSKMCLKQRGYTKQLLHIIVDCNKFSH